MRRLDKIRSGRQSYGNLSSVLKLGNIFFYLGLPTMAHQTAELYGIIPNRYLCIYFQNSSFNVQLNRVSPLMENERIFDITSPVGRMIHEFILLSPT